ncbi:hypothetical protein PhaeoP72_03996 (plasmid) [Phaeobacter inhibens]|uniref:hypothetical protein n=1 Tax=Phaeobacter inhibens TaxID=221822 RepID=UPI000C9A292C|nr:hypothetical protein [Phaeobacter inhibens]AUR05914.1 hypothetical protein PhaeoP72_03996 [Phaeobacter inhibens]
MAWGMSKTRAIQLCGGVFAVLSLVLLFTPHLVPTVFDLESAVSTEIIAKRAGILFAGLTYLTLSTASHPQNATKDRIEQAIALLLMGLAILGAVEWMNGRLGLGVWLAIGIEILLVGLLLTAREERQGQ